VLEADRRSRRVPPLIGARPPCIVVSRGIVSPLILDLGKSGFRGNRHSPAVASDGTLYIPMGNSTSVFRFASDGSQLSKIIAKPPLTLEQGVRAAAVDDETGILFLGSVQSIHPSLLALDAKTLEPRWTTTEIIQCFGLALLPE